MPDFSRRAAWVGVNILPHEAGVRRWLKRTTPAGEIDDIVQEAYCRISRLETVDQIVSPRAYLFKVVRNIILEQIRQAKIVCFEQMTEITSSSIADDEPAPDRVMAGRQELLRVQRLIDMLPARRKAVFELRKIKGMSQREIASMLGVSENVVENETARGLRTILRALAEELAVDSITAEEDDDPKALRRSR